MRSEVGITDQPGMPGAMEFLAGLWRSMSPKDPIEVLLTGSGRPMLRYPKKGSHKDREVLVRAPINRYPPGFKMKLCVKAIRLDPVAAALRGELYMQEFDEVTLDTEAESVVFLASFIMWNVLRKYKLAEGRKGKAGSARYGFANLRAYRSGLQLAEVASEQCAQA